MIDEHMISESGCLRLRDEFVLFRRLLVHFGLVLLLDSVVVAVVNSHRLDVVEMGAGGLFARRIDVCLLMLLFDTIIDVDVREVRLLALLGRLMLLFRAVLLFFVLFVFLILLLFGRRRLLFLLPLLRLGLDYVAERERLVSRGRRRRCSLLLLLLLLLLRLFGLFGLALALASLLATVSTSRR